MKGGEVCVVWASLNRKWGQAPNAVRLPYPITLLRIHKMQLSFSSPDKVFILLRGFISH